MNIDNPLIFFILIPIIYLYSRKFTIEELIHHYMSVTEKYLQKFINRLYHIEVER